MAHSLDQLLGRQASAELNDKANKFRGQTWCHAVRFLLFWQDCQFSIVKYASLNGQQCCSVQSDRSGDTRRSNFIGYNNWSAQITKEFSTVSFHKNQLSLGHLIVCRMSPSNAPQQHNNPADLHNFLITSPPSQQLVFRSRTVLRPPPGNLPSSSAPPAPPHCRDRVRLLQ